VSAKSDTSYDLPLQPKAARKNCAACEFQLTECDLLTATTIATNYWASHLGCSPEELFSLPLRVLTHGEDLNGCDGVVALFRGSAAIVSIPPEREAPLRDLLFSRPGAFSPQILAAALSPVTERIVGPASISYSPKVAPPAHPPCDLGPEHAAARAALQQACAPEDWEAGGGAEEDPSSGIFVDGQLAAQAGYEVWGGTIAHISIVTHPAFRNRGYGRSAVAHAAHRALAAGLLPQYRTLETNGPSLRIARSLGFQSYARSLAVRLRPQG